MHESLLRLLLNHISLEKTRASLNLLLYLCFLDFDEPKCGVKRMLSFFIISLKIEWN